MTILMTMMIMMILMKTAWERVGGMGIKNAPPPFTDGFRKKFLTPLRYEASLREALITITIQLEHPYLKRFSALKV